MTRTTHGRRFLRRFLPLGLALGLCLPGAGQSQICNPDEMPDPAEYYEGQLQPPDVDWQMQAFYPPEGTYLDQIPYLEFFMYFGIPFASGFGSTPFHYLPEGWRDMDLITFTWQRPTSQGARIVREPELRRGAVWVQDPAAAGPADTVMISPVLQVYGEYTGSRDQLFVFEFRNGEKFFGDIVPSELNPELAAWSASSHTIDGTLWYETDDLYIEIGATRTIETEIAWSETYQPDEEVFFAPGDEALSGVIYLATTYERVSADSVRVSDSNIQCAHGFFPSSWYPGGGWDPEVDPSAYGLYVSFSPGVIGENYTYNLVTEDFAGYHVWRRLEGSSEGWINTWKISKNEEVDKYYWWIPMGDGSAQPVFGQTDERVYLDFDVHNGFAYNYAITSFDRGFRPSSGESDHYILDSTPFEELSGIAEYIVFNWQAGETLEKHLYAVPNPLRTGKSAIENPTYHNYPGDVVRFVGLTPGSSLRIFTLAGDLIIEKSPDDMEGMNMVWDTRNQMGELVASGAYIFKASNPEGEEEYGRLVIIR